MNQDIDTFSIVLIKIAHQLIEPKLVEKFIEINLAMWTIEEKISMTKDLKKIGKLYLELRELTKKRAKLKQEKKTY